MRITFNKPYLTGKETLYILDAVERKQLSGNGKYTKLCHQFFEKKYNFKKCLLTSSCTDALEMAAILLNIQEGDEIIMPSFTFVSTANAFILRGGKVIFADSGTTNPNIDAGKIESLISPKTKAIVVVHYAGVSCDMEKIVSIAEKHKLFIVEDAAQAIDSFFINKKGESKPLGSIGHLAAFSFHETKNVISGEGGMLVINDEQFFKRADIIWEKGTNRSAFFRGEIDKYGWVDIGSSFLPSEITAAFLFAQLESLETIQNKRKHIWQMYLDGFRLLEQKGMVQLPHLPGYATNNGHIFYLLLKNIDERAALIEYLKKREIMSVFHYLSLHKSPFYGKHYEGVELVNTDRYSDCLLRLPLYFELSDEDIQFIIDSVYDFFELPRS